MQERDSRETIMVCVCVVGDWGWGEGRDGAMNGYFFLIPSLSPLSDPAILHVRGICEKLQYIKISHHVCKLACLGFCSSTKLTFKTHH